MLVCALAIVGFVINIQTRKHAFNSFHRERIAVCFSTIIFSVISSVFNSPSQIDVSQIHSSVQTNNGATDIKSIFIAVGNWILCCYYFGMQPTFNWCLIFMASLQTKKRQRKFETTSLSQFTDSTETNYKIDGEVGDNSAPSTDTLALQMFNLHEIYPKPMKFIYVFIIAVGSSFIAALLLAAVHAFHVLIIDRSSTISSNSKIPFLYKGLLSPDKTNNKIHTTFQMGTYSYSILSTCIRVIIISVFFTITALQLRNVKNPNKITRKHSWIKLSLTFVIDILPSLLTSLSVFINQKYQSFSSLILLLCAALSTTISFSLVPPCIMINERKYNISSSHTRLQRSV